ncbi:MAG TPA: lysophospholipid acyltransferase family protein [Micromonosporaceae bacterium]|nr:lysophospholipid acyltransferase family protein [Micromonosporaceae bacterium]
MSALYVLGKMTLSPLMRLAWRPRVTGLEHVPLSGAAIFASNHLSVVDSFVIPSVLPRSLYYLAKDEYFRNPGLLGALQRELLLEMHQIPVDRSGGRASLLALDAALPVLRDGNALGIFPEGTRSPDGRLYRGRPGVAKLALDAGAAIVPVGLRGTEHIQPVGARLPRFGPGVDVAFGKPLDLSAWADAKPESRTYRDITAALMAEIAALTGQEYVGRYAPRRSTEALPAGPSPAE